MAGLGTYLSQLREERGPSIEELARVTRVSSRYLEALEREDFAQLPAPVFTKGYIRAYCQALGVPAEEALSRYAETVKIPVVTAPVEAPSARPADDGRRPRGTLLLSFVLLVGFGVALFVVTLLLQSGRSERTVRPAAPSAPSVQVAAKPPTAPPVSEAPAPPPAPATPEVPPAAAPPPSPAASVPSPAAAPATPALRPADSKSAPPVEARPAAADAKPATVVVEPPPLQLRSMVSPYRLVARTMEPTWLRVRTEDGRASEETIPAGEVREWISNRPFVVTIGNAAGVALELNGQKLPPLGGRGAVINRLILPPAEP